MELSGHSTSQFSTVTWISIPESSEMAHLAPFSSSTILPNYIPSISLANLFREHLFNEFRLLLVRNRQREV